MFTIRYFTPYQQQWRTQTFPTLDEAQRMIDFYRSCGSPAKLVEWLKQLPHLFSSLKYSSITLFVLMIETLIASIIVGKVLISPNVIQTEYLTETNQVITVQETIQEVPNN